MIPNVCMSWCQREAQCGWCPEPIKVATPMVTVFYWNKGADGRKWNVQKCYHPQCWVDQGLDYLKRNPYVSTTGRPTLQLSEKEKRQRYLLLRKKTYIDARRRKLLEEDPADKVSLSQLDVEFAEICLLIAQVGGVPPKWLEQLVK